MRDDLMLLAVKAAALRKGASSDPLFPVSWPMSSPSVPLPPVEPDVHSGIGIRAGDHGLGVPVHRPADLAPLTAADRAALETPAAQAASRSAGSSGGHSAGRVGGRSMLASLIPKSRGGKAGLGLAALTGLGGAGYGLFGGSEEAPAPPPPPPEAAPAPPSDVAPRQAVRRFAWGNAGKALGNWWGRMKQTYGA